MAAAAASSSAAMVVVEESEEEDWEQVLRKLLPPGAPLPDPDHLDYSIAVAYHGPPIHCDVPVIQPLHHHPIPSSSASASQSWSAAENLTSPLFAQSQSEADEEEDPDVIQGSRPVHDVRRTVTFEAVVESEGDGDESVYSHARSPRVVAAERRERKRGVCKRCGKAGILKEREACLVCDARYCCSCFLKSMGSMPEGRKCVGCIGRPIDESKRLGLGKPSNMLYKLCSPLEVNHIMKAERECPANQLRPAQVVVNGRAVRQEELEEILGCSNPPQKLKPGRYWYDKDSGFWGKEGEKPDRIITSKLNVGGKLRPDASNGNTQVFINGREITKTELRMLKLAKVQCPRDTHFWVYDDGSYEEEGQNNIRGKIWGKASTRLICSLLSLPTPPSPGNVPASNEEVTTSSNKSLPELEQKKLQKLLLLGLEGAGSSTIFKQAKFLYGNKFTEEELQDIKLLIQKNMYRYLAILLEGRELFEEQGLGERNHSIPHVEEINKGENGVEETRQCIYSIDQRLQKFSDWLLNIMANGDLETFFPAATREYAPLVGEIWKDPAIQETYTRRNELPFLPDVVSYFLDRAIEISSNEYKPSEIDILYAEGITQRNGLASTEFSLDDWGEPYTEHQDRPPQPTKYQLIRVNSKGLTEGCRWLEMFDNVRAIAFCVALSDYNKMWSQGSGPLRNKMMASKELFDSMVRHASFKDIPFVLLLNKYDDFEEKVGRVHLSVCEWFVDFNPPRPDNGSQSLAHHAYYYIALKFKNLYASISNRKLFVCQTKAREGATVDEAFKYIREVLRWDEMKDENFYAITDESFYSTDISSSAFIRME